MKKLMEKSQVLILLLIYSLSKVSTQQVLLIKGQEILGTPFN
jgi:hypothetical protein